MAEKLSNRRLGMAWAALCAVLAVHVADEALTDFLGWWNPMVESLRARSPWVPFPTFRFDVWLGLLAAGVLVLSYLTRYALRGASAMRPLAMAFSVVMIANGLGHIMVSIYLGRMAPGVYSSPLVLAAGAYLLWAAILVGRR